MTPRPFAHVGTSKCESGTVVTLMCAPVAGMFKHMLMRMPTSECILDCLDVCPLILTSFNFIACLLHFGSP